MEIDQQFGNETKAGNLYKVKLFLDMVKSKVTKVARSIKKLGQDDPRRVIHSIKVGLALTLVSLVYLSRPLYDGFGDAGMWAVLTVVVVFEFTVGGTLSKALNRGFATLLAGALGLGAQHFGDLFGKTLQPFVLGMLVFLLATASTFSRFVPQIKARYDYGVLIFILTFSLVSISGYRVEELVAMAQQRIVTILIGGATCMIISMCVCPVWAGEDLHNLVASNIEKLANCLEGFGEEYFQEAEEGQSNVASKNDKSFLEGYKSVLNTKSAEEIMSNLAKWEPRHGRFGYRHPWNQYLRIGSHSRQCAYQIEALNCYINSDVQVGQEFLRIIQESCTKMSKESGKALSSLALSIRTMTNPSSALLHMENSKTAIKDLKTILKAVSSQDADFLSIVPAATVASILIEIVQCVETLSGSVHELSDLAHFKDNVTKPKVSTEIKLSQLPNPATVIPVLDDNEVDHVVITMHGSCAETENNHLQTPKCDERAEVCN